MRYYFVAVPFAIVWIAFLLLVCVKFDQHDQKLIMLVFSAAAFLLILVFDFLGMSIF